MDSIKEELHYAKVPIQGKYFKNFGFFVGIFWQKPIFTQSKSAFWNENLNLS